MEKSNRQSIFDCYLEGSSAPIFSTENKSFETWNKAKKKDKFFLAKDNFWTEKFPATASSSFLLPFFPATDATVIKLLKDKGYDLLGKSTLDEFACGGTGLFSSKGKITNPHNSKHISGGSSSGSAFAVANKLVSFSLGHDTGDSVRRPAAYCGVIGFKPSYGLISRYGLIPMAASLDTVGILSLDIITIQKIFKIIAVPDDRDLVTLSAKKKGRKKSTQKKIAVIKGIGIFLSEEYAKIYTQTVEKIAQKYEVEEVEVPAEIRENLQIIYLILCSSEFVSHLGSLQGITYGQKGSESVEKKRTKYLGKWVKERILIGSYFLKEENFLNKAKRVRRMVKNWVDEVFSRYKFLAFPGTNSSAPTIKSLSSNNNMEISHWSNNLLLLANFTGIPSINIPIGKENEMPVSLNIDSQWKNDKELLKLTRIILKDVLQKDANEENVRFRDKTEKEK